MFRGVDEAGVRRRESRRTPSLRGIRIRCARRIAGYVRLLHTAECNCRDHHEQRYRTAGSARLALIFLHCSRKQSARSKGLVRLLFLYFLLGESTVRPKDASCRPKHHTGGESITRSCGHATLERRKRSQELRTQDKASPLHNRSRRARCRSESLAPPLPEISRRTGAASPLMLELSGFSSGRGSAWLEHLVRDQGVGGSNPLAPIFGFKQIQPVSECLRNGL